MSLKRVGFLSLAVGLVLSAQSAMAVTIDFESYVDPTFLTSFTDQGATFTTIGGADFSISAFGQPTWGTAAPQILCPRLAGSGACESDFEVNFASNVSNLQFFFTGDNAQLVLSVDAYLGATFLGSVFVTSDGNAFSAHLVDLSIFALLDRIVVNEPGDPAGFGYDDFSFTTAAAVPEPGSLALLGGGLLALGALAGRRRS